MCIVDALSHTTSTSRMPTTEEKYITSPKKMQVFLS